MREYVNPTTDQIGGGLAIGEVARRAGLRTSAIRYYERNGLLKAPERINGRMRYPVEAVHTIALIQWGRRAGLSIRELHTLLHGYSPETPAGDRWREIIPPKLDEINTLIARLTSAKEELEKTLACMCPTLDDCAVAFNE